MNTMPFVFSGEKICHTFCKLVDPWFAQLRIRAEESRTLATLRDALLPKLISGDLRIEKPRKFVERIA